MSLAAGVSLLTVESFSLEIPMLYYWWLYTFVAPLAALDMVLRASPLYFGAWPVGLDYLADDY